MDSSAVWIYETGSLFLAPSARYGWMGMAAVQNVLVVEGMQKTLTLQRNLRKLQWEGTGSRCENESRIE